MIIIKQAVRLQEYLTQQAGRGLISGFVPTMGALHQGHLSLIAESRKHAGITVCSIFVNPTQFNDPKDFDKYPKTLEQDILLLEKAGTDILFLPSVNEMYPEGLTNLEHYDLGYLETILDGKFRPGHFQGVCQVMYRLLKLVDPDLLFMGQKDYQQCMVVKRLLAIMESKTKLVPSPTVRESSGLAMSSRNMRLSADQRSEAVDISKILQFIKENLRSQSLPALKADATEKLQQSGFRVDYVEICNADTLEPLESWDGKTPLVALVAAFLGDIRLIDNMILTEIGG
ncbi:pantoate--beta-alanine ligase [Pseudobacter ginsenosidimutans]|uniref:Pantothenate synthetase n=1 Tax=Pseudobacter ginsenosidimutans TaxID=661488 RepID=A0A4Q7N5R4_9BACT|nr:pantoate--beta-alanine ligase [Pseudobacter ginsenosidimutans]QEC44909.1 pantoate--beta-alanine ligase [Pseudobacter ginsenosidimutans]RZS76401.1 pantoate--beta-alanine ligase [Pseudobacter ginsenosidimutans]